jgi:hypothetical protein
VFVRLAIAALNIHRAEQDFKRAKKMVVVQFGFAQGWIVRRNP